MDKIICIGKNYLEHAKELGDSIPEKPILFLKPSSSSLHVIQSTQDTSIVLPKGRGAVHPECEIVVRINAQGEIDAVTLGLDMTLRDVQTALKKSGHPWEIAKVFLQAAVIGPWIELARFQNYLDEPFTLSVDGLVRQKALGKEMIFNPQQCLDHAKEYFPLCTGDVMFTGTPAGVGPVQPGQVGELRWGKELMYQVCFC